MGRGDFKQTGSPLRVVASLGGFQLDASGDGTISALDALRVINGLAQQSLEGESLAADPPVSAWAASADSVFAADMEDDEDDLLVLLAADQELQRAK